MKKTVQLTDEVTNNDGQVFARLDVVLTGDESTPNVRAVGTGPVGFDDNGKAMFPEKDEQQLQQQTQAMMAEAIKQQKQLTKENGGDPSKVNVIGAELTQKAKPSPNQALTAGMMKDIAMLKIQVNKLTKEDDDNAK